MPDKISPRITQVIEDRLRSISTAPSGTRNDTLNRNTFYLARYAKSGTIPVPDLLSLLLQAALNAGLADSDALKTIQSGLQQGLRS